MSESRTLILGLESSCDETACAIVADGQEVLSSIVASQIELHARFGGVVPEIASRAHIEAVNTIIDEALEAAGVTPDELTAISIANEPGLVGSLLTGLMAAKTLAWVWDKPLVAVNHVLSHAYAACLDEAPLEYPAVALVCSGGHTALYRCGGPMDLELLGSTIDDAAGEAFDKVASLLDLGFPGGPAIDKAAAQGDPTVVQLPRSLLKGQSLDFSFSGLKTAVLYHVNGLPGQGDGKKPSRGPHAKRLEAQPNAGRGIEHFTEQEVLDLAAGFQQAVVDTLIIKIRRAVKATGAKTIILGGGVAANRGLRAAAGQLAEKMHCALRMPAMKYCVDNAAMSAGLAYHYYNEGVVADFDLPAKATVRR
jgi:N6-L-threonylcarbamoyladenine synthase